jgi:tetratricopeptide (TPR) repeat protein
MRRALVSGDDKDVAVTLSEYGRTLRELGRFDEAERATRDALAMRLKIFGDAHRETATNKSDLGQLLMDRGEVTEAERLFRENLATTERLLGVEHPNSAAAKNFVGNVLAVKGDWSGAEKLQREALAVRQRVFGPANPESAFAVQSLATTLEMQGRNQEAESLLSDAYRIVTSALGADNPRVVNMTVDISRVRIAGGHAADVELQLRRALEMRQRTYPEGHWRIAEVQALLGASLAAQRRTDEAAALMRAADRVFQPIPGRQARDREANRARLRSINKP